MIIRSKHNLTKDGSLVQKRLDGDNFIFTHAEKLDPILRQAHELREHTDNGWTKDRQFRQIGSVPLTLFLKHPEFYSDTKALVKWLKSDEGAPFRTVKKGL